MINWLKYPPFELSFLDRGPDDDYNGPTFKQAKPIRLLAGGNVIRLRAPKHSFFSSTPSIYVRNQDGMETSFGDGNKFAATDNWKECSLVVRRIEYRLPWFRGTKGSLSMSLAIVTRAPKKAFARTSFFHPRSFEFILSNYLNTQYGHEHDSKGVARYTAPINWQVHQQLPVFSVSFDVEGNNADFCYFFPISDTHFIRLNFFFYGGSDIKFKEEMKVLAKEIIQSVTLELGPQSQAQWDRVKAECPDMNLSESFAPLQWPIKPEDIETSPVVAPFMARTEQLAKP
jgi:hypothetical protein